VRSGGRLLAPFLAVWLLAAVAGAGEPSLEVLLVPQRLGVEDVAQLVVTVTEAEMTGRAPVLGPMVNFRVVSGPSTEQRFSWVNGVAARSVRFTWVLQPRDVGPATVGAVRVRVESGELMSEPITTTVEAGSLASARRGRRSPLDPFVRHDPFQELLGRRPTPELRLALRLLVAKSELVRGEALPITVVLDTTSSVERFEWVEPPSFPGWWTQQVEPSGEPKPELVEAEGVRFYRFPVARYVLIPLKSGRLQLPPLAARVAIRGSSIFSAPRWVERSTKAAEIAVAERPPAPDGFAGAVGALRYRAWVEPETIPFGESAVVTIRLSGSGNLPLVSEPPTWPSCDGCDSYPPEEESRVAVDESGISGERTWRMTVVPRRWGELSLAPVELAVFDPTARIYRRASLGPLNLSVVAPTPTPAPTPAVVAGQGPPEAIPDGAPSATATGGGSGAPWLLLTVALVVGLVGGGTMVWLLARPGDERLPPVQLGQSPAHRARELQAALEAWWQKRRPREGDTGLRAEMEKLRRELEEIRFAPGRADHSQTIADLEGRLKVLLRRA